MFKKTIIAATLLGFASAGSASILVVGAPAVKSPQGILTSVAVAGASFVIDTATPIASGSTIQVAYSKAPTNPSIISATIDDCATTPTVTYAGATVGGTVLNYTVANASTNLPALCELTFGAVSGKAPLFAKADVVAAAVTVTASWTVVGTGVDPVASPKTIVSMLGKDQYGLTLTLGADQEIDVNYLRKKYTVGDTDQIKLTYVDNGGGATDTKSIITVTGDFGWADDPLTAAFDVGARGAGTAQTPIAVSGWALGDGTTAPLPTATTLSLYKATPNAADVATITFTPLTTDLNSTDVVTDDILATALPSTGFTVAQVTSFTDEVTSPGPGAGTQSSTVGTAGSAGAWTLNGASVKVFSVPFGAEVESHSIFVSNKGASTGAISASVVWNGNAPVTIDLGNVQPKANKYLNVIAALEGIGAKPSFGRADITFTVNSPATDITFTAGYTTAAGRANLFMVEQANMSTISNAAKVSSAAAANSASITCGNLKITEDNLDNVAGSTTVFGTAMAASAGSVIAAGSAGVVNTNNGTGAGTDTLTDC